MTGAPLSQKAERCWRPKYHWWSITVRYFDFSQPASQPQRRIYPASQPASHSGGFQPVSQAAIAAEWASQPVTAAESASQPSASHHGWISQPASHSGGFSQPASHGGGGFSQPASQPAIAADSASQPAIAADSASQSQKAFLTTKQGRNMLQQKRKSTSWHEPIDEDKDGLATSKAL